MARRRVDIGAVVALVWLLTAIGLTALLAPHLGVRGWLWVGLHDVVCVAGCVHELRRAARRRRALNASLVGTTATD
jgi:hypothetical protein